MAELKTVDEMCAVIDKGMAELDALRQSVVSWRARAQSAETQLAGRAKDMLKLRERFINIRDELADEGDRVFFGSTNDADTFRDAVEELDAWAWHDVMEEAKGRDLYAEMRELRERVRAAQEALSYAASPICPPQANHTETK